jgi:acyl-CoA thioesterase-2
MDSPVLRGCRGLNTGRIYRRDGRLVVSCTQEALIRVRELPPGGGAGDGGKA